MFESAPCPACEGTGKGPTVSGIETACLTCDGRKVVHPEMRRALMSGRSVDFIARLAEAWDGHGRHALSPPFELRALVALSGMRPEIAGLPWKHIKPDERRALLFAARRAVELARACAWVFGEGQGA